MTLLKEREGVCVLQASCRCESCLSHHKGDSLVHCTTLQQCRNARYPVLPSLLCCLAVTSVLKTSALQESLPKQDFTPGPNQDLRTSDILNEQMDERINNLTSE